MQLQHPAKARPAGTGGGRRARLRGARLRGARLRGARLRFACLVLPVRLQPCDLDAQRQPYPRVMARRHIGGPRALLGQPLGRVGGEGGAARCQCGGRGAGEPVGDGVEEGAHQRLGPGQPQRALAGQRDRVRVRRHRRGQVPQPLDVGRLQRAHPPGVVVLAAQPGQQPSARGQVQCEDSRAAPEGRGTSVSASVSGTVAAFACPRAGARQHGKRLAYGQAQRGHGARARVSLLVGQRDGQGSGGVAARAEAVGVAGVVGTERRGAVRAPEGDL
ncbi:pentapeptide repeat-containing protein [Streptomyces sp. NPDC054796]